ncbi:SGNH/GDSL hydrolase family protein [Curtobacterium sp. VKM Ac-2922]|uniref:SGNH/GDSL hydrolase family protein n=1 Tax=Curtobacterium sp. VKM Ac-2922 TaxID=2929475 RepID=UPI001FB3B7F0|nr:SGNH/GDSL hydrolase family protein [Curtobacterium sp. VKM Ac-2922]MCJ1715251.1 SGNH/GDSL hydrolase family protein [Curtobacterium sp. VKM Ac-2922]
MRPRHIVTVASLVAALVAVPTVVALASHPTVATTATAQAARIAAAQIRELQHTPHQVLTGVVGADVGGAVTFAYAGDSITARPGSWLRDLAADTTDTGVHALGGYAHSGNRTDQVLARMPAVPGADVLVVELGTNDVNQGVPTTRILRNIDTLVAHQSAPHVLLIAAPPSNHTSSLWGVDRRTENRVLDRALAADAQQHGWSYADPFAADRASDDGWLPGTSADGIHPTTAANVAIAGEFATAIRAAAGRGTTGNDTGTAGDTSVSETAVTTN